MDNSNLLVGLDIGTTNVKAVVADSGKVIGAVAVPNNGMRHGKIVDIDQTADAIHRALSEIAKKANTKVSRVVTGIPVGMLQLETAGDMINVGDQAREIENRDVKRVLQATLKSAVKKEHEPIAYLPSYFLIDGKTDVDDPRKMIAHSLSVQGILLTAPANALHNIKKAIERAGYQNNFFVPIPLAIASVALDEGERTFGSIILDFGGGVTTATVIHEGKVKYANIDFEGGSDISNDISVVLSTSKKDAERFKLDYGFATPDLASKNDKFAVNSVGVAGQKMVSEEYLSKIINARLLQIIGRVGKGLNKHGALKLPGGIIITGGSSLLQGIDQLVAKQLGIKTRVYQPDQIGMRNPAFSAAYGIVNYAHRMSDIDFLIENAIYGSDVLDQESNEKVQKNSEILTRKATNAETNRKEAYNKHKLPRKEESLKAKTKSNKQDKSIKGFFKKFFD